jgi:hypothetical protein
MPAKADTVPVSTKVISFVRATLTPVKCAASLLRPMSKTPRPKEVKCSSSANATISTRIGTTT